MRKFFRAIHKWLAIPAGIVITITCLTGAILVFQDELLRLTHHSRYYVEDIKEETILMEILIPMVNAQLEDNAVVNVSIFSNPKRTYQMSLENGFRVSVFVNQYTGEVTGIYNFSEGFFYFVLRLHRWLMDTTRTWGKQIVGISTIIFAVILISGILIWFPKKFRFKKRHFKIRFKKSKGVLFYDLHNVLGMYACIVLLICALTGLMWSFEWYRNGVFKLFNAEVTQTQHGGGQRNQEKEKKIINTAQWQYIADQIKEQNPNYEYIRIQDGNALVHLKSAVLSRATDKYVFDKNSGEIIRINYFKDEAKTTKIWAWVYSLHVGNYWGIWSKIYTFIFALIGASLPITGYYLFFIKRIRKRKKDDVRIS
ncbi:MAG: PepSY domain-containing protein [Bacteroidales bacterium]|jgi:uncharacterized iron-regulated membrane protein|nr:PepSY domain-containing protein [Bacteroidales bacterium]